MVSWSGFGHSHVLTRLSTKFSAALNTIHTQARSSPPLYVSRNQPVPATVFLLYYGEGEDWSKSEGAADVRGPRERGAARAARAVSLRENK